MLDALLHAIGGAAFAAVLWYGGHWTIAPTVLAFGLLREQAQHRDEGWIGWVSWHRLGEACAFGAGAAALVAVAWLLERL